MTRLSERFPDISFIMEMFREMRSQGVEVDGESKYYPNTLLLAVLFRLQARQEGPFKKAGEELEERSSLVELLGYFWHQLDSVAVILREGLKGETREEVSQGIEESRVRIAERLGFEEVDVPLASVSELRGEEEQLRIDDHCPDFVVVVDRAHKVILRDIDVGHILFQAVVLFILGSRGYPGPRGPLDFVMDFSLSTVPYLGGEAHSGILKGAANLEKAALPCLLQQLSLNQGFSLLFVGYSLGAGNHNFSYCHHQLRCRNCSVVDGVFATSAEGFRQHWCRKRETASRHQAEDSLLRLSPNLQESRACVHGQHPRRPPPQRRDIWHQPERFEQAPREEARPRQVETSQKNLVWDGTG